MSEKPWQKHTRQLATLQAFAREKVEILQQIRANCAHEGEVLSSSREGSALAWWQCGECGEFMDKAHES